MGRKYFFTFREKTRGLGTTSLTSVGDGTELYTFNLSKILLSTTKIQRKGHPATGAGRNARMWFLSTSFSNIIAIVSPRGSTCADTNRLSLHIPCAHFPYAIAASLHLLILLLITWVLDGVYLPLVWPVWPWHSPWNLHPSRGSSHMACGTTSCYHPSEIY